MIGQQIGPYAVVSKLGEGGMGEVYRAHDPRLHRDVAIKVLPEIVAADVDRVARFKREAQVLAALNHPNIAHIHGFEETKDGHALVMELVDGEDLSTQISRGALSVHDAAAVAGQIANALEAAHEQGIIHRDLKPGNIKVRPDGVVKVLDFGLAKALAADPIRSASDAMNSPTLTARATQMGVVLGTAAYMSPEQAKARPVDKRADIWAFGAVLYEMLTGRRAFDGEDVSETLAAVLTRDPDMSALPASTPPALSILIRRCLERDPKRRLRDIGEARLILEDRATLTSPAAVPAGAVPAGRALIAWRVAAAVLGLGVLVTGALWWQATRTETAEPIRLSVLAGPSVTFDLTLHPSIAISKDGSTIAFAGIDRGVRRLYVRRLGDFGARVLEGTEGASTPFFRPDGSWIGYHAVGKIKKVPTGGGPSISLADVNDPRGAVWTPSDTIIYSPSPSSPVFEVPAAGGTPNAVSKLDTAKNERTHRWPEILPDGKTVLVTVGSVEHPDDYDNATIEAIRLETNERRVVIAAGRAARYVSTGHLLFVRDRVLYAVPFDPASLAAGNSPAVIIDGVSGDSTTGSSNFAVADAGTLAMIPGDVGSSQRRLVWLDSQKKLTPIDAPVGVYSDPHLAPNGRWVAVSVLGSSSNREIYLIDTERGTLTKVTSDGASRTPVWSTDGTRLIYISYDRARNVSKIMDRLADGSSEPTVINEVAGQAYAESLTPDGATLLLTQNPGFAGTRMRVLRLALQKGSKPELVADSSEGDVQWAMLSPDGKRVAYVSWESGRGEVFVQAFPSGGGRTQISNTGGIEPRWSPNGRTLYYINPASELIAIPLDAGPAFSPGKPRKVLDNMAPMFTDSGQTYTIAKDERLLLLRYPSEDGQQSEVRIVQNFFRELTAIR